MQHCYAIKVRGFHCDLYGHVNNARYLEFLEEARWAFVEEVPALAALESKGLGFVIAAVTIEYKRPVGLGETVEIHSAMAGVEAKRAVMHQEVRHQVTGKTIADAHVSFAIIDLKTGRAVPLTDERRGWFGLPAAERSET